jgi:hypothetical protein
MRESSVEASIVGKALSEGMISGDHRAKGDILIEDIETVKTTLKSRMKREFHVQFCEKVGVKFPRLTRLAVVLLSEVRKFIVCASSSLLLLSQYSFINQIFYVA